MTRMTVSEMEVADAAHYMGYELLRAADGYVLCRRYGAADEIIKVATLKDVTKYLTH